MSVHWPTFVKGVAAIVALVIVGSVVKSCNQEANRRRNIEFYKQESLAKRGYRLNENGVMTPQSEDQQWREGINVDYKYEGRESTGKVAVFAKKDQKKVYVQKNDYDETGLYGPVSYEGQWIDKGVVSYKDRDGASRLVTITGRFE